MTRAQWHALPRGPDQYGPYALELREGVVAHLCVIGPAGTAAPPPFPGRWRPGGWVRSRHTWILSDPGSYQ